MVFTSCLKDKCEREITYVKTIPIYYSLDDIRVPVTLESIRVLEKPGKIYYYKDFLFINEQKEGVHIYDNSDPQNPTKVGFYNIPGNVDISIANDMLYADSYRDLVTVNISDVFNPLTEDRVEDAFENYYYIDPSTNLLLDYEYEEVTEVVDCNDRGWGWGRFDDVLVLQNSGAEVFNSGGDFVGTGGSLARFTISNGHLYTIDHSNLHVFDIQQGNNPSKINEVPVNWQIETIFPYQDKLFIGSTTGLFVMDISSPADPYHISSYGHAFSCDPVYVKAPYAYVTLRTEANWCQEGLNQLDLVDISDITNIKLEKSFPMENPHGLSVRDESLFICEGDNGLKVYNISDPLTLDERQLAHLRSIKSRDIITLPGAQKLMLVIGDDGFYQYDGNDPANPQLLSTILIGK
jgi:hypothetical protein